MASRPQVPALVHEAFTLASSASASGSLAAMPLQQWVFKLQQWVFKLGELSKQCEGTPLTMAVMALTKSGKSTLLNAIMGSNFLPNTNVPETAAIVMVKDDPHATEPMIYAAAPDGGEVVVARGQCAVREYLRQRNADVRSQRGNPNTSPDANAAQASAAQSGSRSQPLLGMDSLHIINIRTRLPAAAGHAGAAQAHNPRLVLLDTPGPNEAGAEHLKAQIERLLDSVDAVLYVLDYTKLKTDDEATLFQQMVDTNPAMMHRMQQRLFFVVNKVDMAKTCAGQGREETCEYVSTYVTKTMREAGCTDFYLPPEKVMLLSARDAQLASTVQAGTASPDDVRQLLTIAFGTKYERRPPTAEQVSEAVAEMLEDSGLAQLLKQVLGYLSMHAAPIKQLRLLDDLFRVLCSMNNTITAFQAGLLQDVEQLKSTSGALKARLQQTRGALAQALAKSKATHTAATDKVYASLDILGGHLAGQIDAALAAPADNVSASSATPSGPWAQLRKLAKQVITFGAASEETHKREQLEKQLLELHSSLREQLRKETDDFWRVLESDLQADMRVLIEAISAACSELAAQMEGTVAQELKVDMLHVDIKAHIPSPEEFHSDIKELINRGIESRSEDRMHSKQEEYNEQVPKYGVCGITTGYTTETHTRTVQEQQRVEILQLQPTEVHKYFMTMVESAIATSRRAVGKLVDGYVKLQVERASVGLEEYCGGFVASISAALAVAEVGTDECQAAQEGAQRMLVQVEELREQTRQLTAETEQALQQTAESEQVLQQTAESEQALRDPSAVPAYYASASPDLSAGTDEVPAGPADAAAASGATGAEAAATMAASVGKQDADACLTEATAEAASEASTELLASSANADGFEVV